MIFLGLLIALAAAAFAAVVLAENWGGVSYTVHGFGATLGSLTLAEIFLAGIILTAIFFIALWVAGLSTSRRRRTSLRRREETRSVREEREGLLADRDRLARALAEERSRSGVTGPGYVEPGRPEPGYATERETAVYRESPAPIAAEDARPDEPTAYPNDPYDPRTYREPAYRDAGYREPAYGEPVRERDR